MKTWTKNVSSFNFRNNFLLKIYPGLAAAKHAEFLRARVRHYSNEAEAMKVSIPGVNQIFISLMLGFY